MVAPLLAQTLLSSRPLCSKPSSPTWEVCLLSPRGRPRVCRMETATCSQSCEDRDDKAQHPGALSAHQPRPLQQHQNAVLQEHSSCGCKCHSVLVKSVNSQSHHCGLTILVTEDTYGYPSQEVCRSTTTLKVWVPDPSLDNRHTRPRYLSPRPSPTQLSGLYWDEPCVRGFQLKAVLCPWGCVAGDDWKCSSKQLFS